MIRKEDALLYHRTPSAGKLAVVPTKPCRTQRELSLAYTPGVAVPCLEIYRNPALVNEYTARANLVAVISNGTAVLGLGNIGPYAGKPVMEGKAVLFKRFADIDVFDIELAATDPRDVIHACKMLEPTFGGINLEDIKSPECFGIEETLIRSMSIPVFHDDQHGTAIISGAALLNAVEIVGKRIDRVKVVFSGAGAAGIACATHYLRLGVKRENITMSDILGVVYRGRVEGMNPYMERFAQVTEARTLAEALEDADVFVGVSAANIVTPEMLAAMASNPIIFALANPDPEIPYEAAVRARPDAIVCTGRSDYPNQVNNVLGFPFIFRGALDAHATAINEEMKLAATYALAALAKEDVPDAVRRAYGTDDLHFGRDYVIPKAFDQRVLVRVASAVAQAAVASGVARRLLDIAEYKDQLERRFGKAGQVMRAIIHKAQRNPERIVFPEGEDPKVLRASQILKDENIAAAILVGREQRIRELACELHLRFDGITIVDPSESPDVPRYAQELYRIRQRNGLARARAAEVVQRPNTFAIMMLHMGDADAFIGGLAEDYTAIAKAAACVIPLREGLRKMAGLHLLFAQGQMYFFADCSVNVDPSADELAEIAILAAETARRFDAEPRVAMLSFSSFGSTPHPLSEKVRRAVEIAHRLQPDLVIDGEIQADVAVAPEVLAEEYPFSAITEGANVLIFPSLEAGNIAYRLLRRLGSAEVIGPILMGLTKPVHVIRPGADVNDIVNIAAIAAVDAQTSAAERTAETPVPRILPALRARVAAQT